MGQFLDWELFLQISAPFNLVINPQEIAPLVLTIQPRQTSPTEVQNDCSFFLSLKGLSMTRFVFVTGGVVSSVGKGVCVGSIGKILKSRGMTVSLLKLDPYLNVDPGTMSPINMGKYLSQVMGVKPISIWVIMKDL